MLILGVLGTAKNTGKTTTTNALLKCLSDKPLAITSIGFDGEDLDHITGLPKPKVFVEESTVVATSEMAAKHSTAKLQLLKKLEITTALGPVGIYRVKQPGTVVLVGPHSSNGLLTLAETLRSENIEIFLVDGAINRIVPFQHADFVILAVGASRSTNIDFLFLETKVIIRTFELPLGRGTRKVLKGLISTEKLSMFRGESISVESPMHLLLTEDFAKLEKLLQEIDIAVMRKPKLLCVTINPCYAERRAEGFTLAQIDLSELSKMIERELNIPCLDVAKEEERLCRIVEEEIGKIGTLEGGISP